jgi:hypothetical protein
MTVRTVCSVAGCSQSHFHLARISLPTATVGRQSFYRPSLLLGAGIIWVFDQLHRNPILSRITDTNANEFRDKCLSFNCC